MAIRVGGVQVILLGLGSSRAGPWGSPGETLRRCVREISGPAFTVEVCSSLYETAGVGPGRSGVFANGVISGRSHLSPEALLRMLKQLERRAGGRSAMPWGPRNLDIDILAYKGRIVGQPERGGPGVRRGARLVIPHPQLHLRPFVLGPLAEIAPEWRHPVLRLSARTLWKSLSARSEGRILRKLDALC